MGTEGDNVNQRHEERGLFPAVFDEQIFVGPEEGNEAYFGLNVLRGFVQVDFRTLELVTAPS